jgi:MFS family permease
VTSPTVDATERVLTPRFVLVVVVGLAYFLSLGMLLPVVPLYVQKALGEGDLQVGIAVGAFSFGAVILRPYAGRIGDQRGRRLLIVGGAATVAVAVAGYHLASAVPALVAARLLGGVGEAAFFVGAGTMITDLAPSHRRGEAISYWSVAVYGGLAFGPALGEAVLDGNHYGRVWAVSAVLAFGAALLGLFTQETMTPLDQRPAGQDPPPLISRSAIAPGTILFLGLVSLAGFTEFVPLYVTEIGMTDSGPVLLVYGGVVLAVRIFGARLPDRLGPRRAGSIATSMVAVGMVVIAAWATPAGLYAGTVLFAIGMSLLYPALLTLALMGVPDTERGSAVGTVSSFFDASQGLGAILLGGVAAFAGHRGSFVAGAALALVGLALLRGGLDPRARAPIDHGAARAATEYLEPDPP